MARYGIGNMAIKNAKRSRGYHSLRGGNFLF